MTRLPHRLFEHVHAQADQLYVSSAQGSAVPSDKVHERGIVIGPWTVRVLRGSIANAADMDVLADLLDIPPPEMPFIKNALVLQHEPSGFSYVFDAVRALQCVLGVRDDVQRSAMDCAYASQYTDVTETYHRPRRPLSQSGVQVSYAKEWGESR